MTARERTLALRLLEKQRKNPDMAKKLGIEIKIVNNDANREAEKDVQICRC